MGLSGKESNKKNMKQDFPVKSNEAKWAKERETNQKEKAEERINGVTREKKRKIEKVYIFSAFTDINNATYARRNNKKWAKN